MNSIFRYPGGKTRKGVRDKILAKAPSYYDEYRECMAGGAGIFFSIDKSKKRWINDKDENLISVYKALRDRPQEFIASCREILPEQDGEELAPAREGGNPLYNARLKKWFDYFSNCTECDPALRYFFTNRTVWAGRVNYDIPSRMYFSVPEGWNIVGTKRLEEAAECLSGVKITSGSYERCLLDPSPGKQTWVYVDPPYVVNTKLDKNSQLYRHNFTEQDHIELADTIRYSPHKICVSYDEDPDGLVRSLYPEKYGFKIYEESWTYCGTSSAPDLKASAKAKKKGKELLILNYEI